MDEVEEVAAVRLDMKSGGEGGGRRVVAHVLK